MSSRSVLLIPFLILPFFHSAQLSAQPAQRTDPDQRLARIRDWNNRLLNLSPESKPAAKTPRSTVAASPAREILAGRAAELLALMREHPREALAIAFSQDLASRLREEYPDDSDLLETHGVWEGAANYVVLDDHDNERSESHIRLSQGEGWAEVHFAEDAPDDLSCEKRLRVRGVRLGGVIAAQDGETMQASTSTPCIPTGPQRIAVFMVTFPDVTPPTKVTPEMLEAALFGSGSITLQNYWREASYGLIPSTTGRVFPWRTLSKAYTCDEYWQLLKEVVSTFDPEVDFREFNRVFIVFPKPPTGCAWSGLGTVGCTSINSAEGTLPSSVAWLVANSMPGNNETVMLTAHEGGHNLGLSHASSRDHGVEVVGQVGVKGTISEYGDKFSTMGYWNLGHYSARHKQQLGWLSGSSILAVNADSAGTYTVTPMSEQNGGVKALKVQRGANNAYYWIEARRPVGVFDAKLRSQAFDGALIHYQDSYSGNRTHLLDFTPATSTFDDPALSAGSTWKDTYTSFQVAASAAGSNLSIQLGSAAPACVQALPTVSLSPANPTVVTASKVEYTFTVRNNDSASCPAAVFSLSSPQPSGWSSLLSTPSISLAPGASGTVTITKIASSTLGTFTVTGAATRGASVTQATAYCTVVAPAGLQINVVPVKPAFAVGEVWNFNIAVTQGGLPVYPGSVSLLLTRPNGSYSYRSVQLGADGKAALSYVSSKTLDVPGVYQLKAVLYGTVRGTYTFPMNVLPAP